jgi:DNA-binding transcriptional MerR regulator
MYRKELQEKTGVTRDALRHYQSIGLIAPARNPHNAYLEYSLEDVETIQFITKAKKLGFSLEEIKLLLSQMQSSECKHQSLLPFLEQNLLEIRDRIKELQKIKRHLEQLVKNFQTKNCTVKPSKLEI